MSFEVNKQKLLRSRYSFLVSMALLFLLLMNYTVEHTGGIGLMLPFNNTSWLGFAAIMLSGMFYVAVAARVKVCMMHLAYTACAILLLLPLIYSDTTFLRYEYTTILAILACLVLILLVSQFNTAKFKQQILIILFCSSLMQTGWGLLQYYFISEPSLLFLAENGNRPVGTFNQINVFATYLSLGSLLSIYFLFNAEKRTKWSLLTTITVLILNAHLCVLAEVRTGLYVSLIALGMYLSLISIKKRTVLLPICLLLISVTASLSPKHWFVENQATFSERGKTYNLRLTLYKEGFNLATEKPITGHGIGMVRNAFTTHMGAYSQQHEDYIHSESVSHIHNEPLQWMIQLGVVSFLAFIALFVAWVWGIKNKKIDPLILFIALPFVGHSMLELPFHASVPHLLAFAIILGVSIKGPMRNVNLNKTVAKSAFPITAIVCIQITVFVFNSLSSLSALTEYRKSGMLNLKPLETTSPTSSFAPYFEIEKFQTKLENGFKTGQIDKDIIFNFIDWAEKNKHYLTIYNVYIRLAQSYIITGDKTSAMRVLNETLFLFPNNDDAIDMVNTMKDHVNKNM